MSIKISSYVIGERPVKEKVFTVLEGLSTFATGASSTVLAVKIFVKLPITGEELCQRKVELDGATFLPNGDGSGSWIRVAFTSTQSFAS